MIIIEADRLLELQRSLKEKQEKGNDWLIYADGQPLRPGDFFCYAKKLQARKEAFNATSDKDFFAFAPVRTILHAIGTELSQKDPQTLFLYDADVAKITKTLKKNLSQ